MNRTAVVNEYYEAVGWFDKSKAIEITEESHHDGNNLISLATQSQWDHEAIYYTANGRWILHKWSNWQGSRSMHTEITANDACLWIIQNNVGLEHLDGIPQSEISRIEKLAAMREL